MSTRLGSGFEGLGAPWKSPGPFRIRFEASLDRALEMLWKGLGRSGRALERLGPLERLGRASPMPRRPGAVHDYLNDAPRRSSVVHHLGNDAPRQSGVVHHLCNDAPRRTGVVHHLGNDAPRRTGVVHHSGYGALRHIGAVSHVLSERFQGHPEPFQGAPRPSKALPRFNPKDLRNESETVLASSKAR